MGLHTSIYINMAFWHFQHRSAHYIDIQHLASQGWTDHIYILQTKTQHICSLC